MAFSLLLVSKDQDTIKSIESIAQAQNLNLILQPIVDSVILTTIEEPLNLFLYDMVDNSENHMDTLKVIKTLNPQLPIVVLTEDNSIDTLKTLAQLKVYYCALKPTQTHEIETIINTIKSKTGLYKQ